MADYQIELELTEPLFCGSKHAVSNEMTSLEFIPGTSLRGSLASELAYSARTGEIPTWFGATGPRWTPALPSPSDRMRKDLDDPNAFIVPTPLSFLREKRDSDPFTGLFGVVNALHADPPDRDKEGDAQQWTRLNHKWLVVSKGQPLGVFSPGKSTSMHVGLHYGRQSNREEALFSRRGMAAGNRFTAWVQDSQGALGEDFPASTVIGKRTSTGNGFVALRWRQGPFPWLGQGGSEEDEATVQLIGDAIVPAPDGRWSLGLGAAQWERILGMNVEVKAAFTATRGIRNWSNSWGLPREHTLAIASGSVFRLKSATGGGSAWKMALDRLAQEGLGRTRHEGFGWVSVNPSWLTNAFLPPRKIDAKEKEWQRRRDPRPQPWPGLESVDRSLVVQTLEKVRKLTAGLSREKVAKVGELGSYAARTNDCADVVLYLDGLAGRTNPRGWDDISRAIKVDLTDIRSIELMRFFLNGIETLHE